NHPHLPSFPTRRSSDLLIRQALVTLAVGLALAALVAGIVTAILDRADALPTKYDPASASFLHGLTHVDETTVLIALAAGIAAMQIGRAHVRTPVTSPSR